MNLLLSVNNPCSPMNSVNYILDKNGNRNIHPIKEPEKNNGIKSICKNILNSNDPCGPIDEKIINLDPEYKSSFLSLPKDPFYDHDERLLLHELRCANYQLIGTPDEKDNIFLKKFLKILESEAISEDSSALIEAIIVAAKAKNETALYKLLGIASKRVIEQALSSALSGGSSHREICKVLLSVTTDEIFDKAVYLITTSGRSNVEKLLKIKGIDFHPYLLRMANEAFCKCSQDPYSEDAKFYLKAADSLLDLVKIENEQTEKSRSLICHAAIAAESKSIVEKILKSKSIHPEDAKRGETFLKRDNPWILMQTVVQETKERTIDFFELKGNYK